MKKKQNSGWQVHGIMIFKTLLALWLYVEHLISTYRAVKYADCSRLVNLGEACLRLE